MKTEIERINRCLAEIEVSQRTAIRYFLYMAEKCPHRKPKILTFSRPDWKMWQCTHSKLEDPHFGWTCEPLHCPLIIKVPSLEDMWGDVHYEPGEEEMENGKK